MPDYYTQERLGDTQYLTPEGYLLCTNVAISRCGTLLYGEHELEGLEGRAGIIHVERLPEDVLDPKSIASYAGKPLIVTHAGGTINPSNWRDYMVGTVLAPRRGEAPNDNTLFADLLVYDAEAIVAIREKTERGEKHQVSAGYNAEYEQLSPGRARQYEILGNHVALVDNGRCGPRCSIGDEAMTVPRRRIITRKPTMDAATKAAIIKAFRTGDEEALENAMNTAGPDGVGDDPQPEMGSADTPTTHNITVNIGGAGAPTVDDPTVPGAPVMPGASPVTPPAGTAEGMPAWAAPIMARLDAIEAKVNGAAPAPAAAAPAQETEDSELEGMSAEEMKANKDATKALGTTTMDAAPDMVTYFRATMATAELLAPGVKLLTMDGKRTVKQTMDDMCAFRRQVLSRATTDAAMSERIGPLIAGKDLAKLPCSVVKATFDAAGALVAALNSRATTVGFMPRPKSNSTNTVMSPSEINIANRKKYGYID